MTSLINHRRKMTKKAVAERQVPFRFACVAFGISETCYRYQANLSDENADIADRLFDPAHQ